MARLVVDSSVAAAWCFPDEETPYTEAVLLAVAAPAEAFAPRLWAYEIRNSVLIGVRRNRISPAHGKDFLDTLKRLPVRLADPPSYDALFDLAWQRDLTVYDAAYLDLAMRENLPIATLDDALLRAARASDVAVFQP